MKTILFQGDSITDAQRYKDDPDHMGSGYAIMVAGELGIEAPGKYRFINRGVSGNRSVDVVARMKHDILDIKPDYMSLMVGVNDVWHKIEINNGCGEDALRSSLETIIAETRASCPGVRLMLIEPYLLREYATENTPEMPDKWEYFRSEVEKRAKITREVAEKYGIKFVALQEKLDRAAEEYGAAYWASDGVHPTPMGHELIKREWIKAFREIETD